MRAPPSRDIISESPAGSLQVPLVVVNLEAQRNQLRLLYEDAGTPLEEELKNGNKLPLAQATKPPPPREPPDEQLNARQSTIVSVPDWKKKAPPPYFAT